MRPGSAGSTGAVVECEVSTGIPAIAAVAAGGQALVLVRVFGEPIGVLSVTLPADGLTPSELAREIVAELEPELRERFVQCGLSWTGELPTGGLHPLCTPYFVATRKRVMREGPQITVAVCTRDRTDDLALLLESLRNQEYQRTTILVVDNAPSDDRTRRLVHGLTSDLDVSYVTEPRPGLSWARNRAIEESDTEVIAWADDDEICDRWWTAELARAFVEVPSADAATGIVVPGELQTQSQVWFEQYSGVRRGRGFTRHVFSPATAVQQSPLYPLPPYGAGANMAFRREAIDRIGRFDPALGAGTSTLAGEDTAALSALLLAGGTIVYQPSAIVHHRHRRDYAALQRVMLGYGRGLGAYYASMVAHRPSCLPELVKLSRQALRDQLTRRGGRLGDLDGFPPDLLRLNRKGLIQGAFMYPGARLRARRLASAATRSATT
ncbi:MAG TPA: glycosyltransferase family 2 protein [Solirubrobacteraceae bacterium]|nr:glycosyltransferase family 2 protein [Solirubrobacteraceae bacterium]